MPAELEAVGGPGRRGGSRRGARGGAAAAGAGTGGCMADAKAGYRAAMAPRWGRGRCGAVEKIRSR